MTETLLQGTVERGFERVRDSFARGLQKAELGAAVSAYVGGRKVVDLWGGWADPSQTRPWQRNTIAGTMSATKGMTSTCAHQLVDRGLLDVDEPVATYWPEFAAEGKERITVRMVLSHQAGLLSPTVRVPPEKRWDWATVTDALARSKPRWEPGTRSEYHGGTFGYLVGGILQRVDGRSLDSYFREEIAEPLGADFLIRVGPEDDHRCAELVGPDDLIRGSNSQAFRQGADGSATGHGTAESLARMYGALAGSGELEGVRLLRPETIASAVQPQPLARAEGMVDAYGLGYQLLWKLHPELPKGTFGHEGLGGSIGLADPAAELGFGFVVNRLGNRGAAHLLGAVYSSLQSSGVNRLSAG
jgi:CubicO group peptidase (beta-lactamase class C family)